MKRESCLKEVEMKAHWPLTTRDFHLVLDLAQTEKCVVFDKKAKKEKRLETPLLSSVSMDGGGIKKEIIY